MRAAGWGRICLITSSTLNLACPGLHATDRMKQLGGLGSGVHGEPDDFGRVVAFLCSEPAKFVSGAALQVDGAATLGLL
jgi:3-oxoacyl-[acyl-carrier protein] reductase